MPSRSATMLDEGASTVKNQSRPNGTSGATRRRENEASTSITMAVSANQPLGSAHEVTWWTACMIDCPSGQIINARYRQMTIACVSSDKSGATPVAETGSGKNRYRMIAAAAITAKAGKKT